MESMTLEWAWGCCLPTDRGPSMTGIFQINPAVTALQRTLTQLFPKPFGFVPISCIWNPCRIFLSYSMENRDSQPFWLPVDFRHHQTTWLLHNSRIISTIYENTHSLSLSISSDAMSRYHLNSSKMCFLGVELQTNLGSPPWVNL